MAEPTRLWHPFAAMGKVDGHELVLTRGEGSRVWDADGNEYLDATAGLWFANVGHGRAEIADAVGSQLTKLAAHHIFGDHANEPALALASRVAAMSPVPDAAVFFCSGGEELVLSRLSSRSGVMLTWPIFSAFSASSRSVTGS